MQSTAFPPFKIFDSNRFHGLKPGELVHVVTRIVPESPAKEAGIESGDIIASIDNQPAQKLTLTEMRSMFRQPDAHYTIGIIRGDRQLRFAIRLRPLI